MAFTHQLGRTDNSQQYTKRGNRDCSEIVFHKLLRLNAHLLFAQNQRFLGQIKRNYSCCGGILFFTDPRVHQRAMTEVTLLSLQFRPKLHSCKDLRPSAAFCWGSRWSPCCCLPLAPARCKPCWTSLPATTFPPKALPWLPRTPSCLSMNGNILRGFRRRNRRNTFFRQRSTMM